MGCFWSNREETIWRDVKRFDKWRPGWPLCTLVTGIELNISQKVIHIWIHTQNTTKNIVQIVLCSTLYIWLSFPILKHVTVVKRLKIESQRLHIHIHIPVAFCPNNYSLQTAKCTPTVLCSCPLTVFVYRSGQRSFLIKHQNENTSVIFELEVW